MRDKDKKRIYGKKYRAEHLEKRKEYDKRYRKLHHDQAIEYSGKYYTEHREEAKARTKKYRKEHLEWHKAYCKLYDTQHREERRIYGARYHREHPNLNKRRAYYKQMTERYKREVLTHYGQGNLECMICHDTRIHVLTIDHIGGNGKQHLKSVGIHNGVSLYRWLKKNGYPEGFRTLCFNCQILEYRRGMGEDVEIWDWNKPHSLPHKISMGVQ